MRSGVMHHHVQSNYPLDPTSLVCFQLLLPEIRFAERRAEMITAIDFWEAYKREMVSLKFSRAHYETYTPWGASAIDVAIKTICSTSPTKGNPMQAVAQTTFPRLKHQKEYFRIDAIGYECVSKQAH